MNYLVKNKVLISVESVMKTMGHPDVKTATRYQDPELDVVRAELDYSRGKRNR